jgi:hypothetical protein
MALAGTPGAKNSETEFPSKLRLAQATLARNSVSFLDFNGYT